MELSEVTISRAIVERFFEKLTANLEVDAAVVGAGPSGLVAAYHLARAGKKVALFERKLSLGGGMWGGGMMFNEIVVQDEALPVLADFGLEARPYGEGYHTLDSVLAISSLISGAARAGVTMFNCMSVEDVVMRADRIVGLVINWSAVEIAGLHVDPLTVKCGCVIDATGHAAEVVKVVERKVPGKLGTPSGGFEGEKSLWADRAEALTLDHTGEVYPGLFIAGMAANATMGGPRMGPIFGGMLLSGKKVFEMVMKEI